MTDPIFEHPELLGSQIHRLSGAGHRFRHQVHFVLTEGDDLARALLPSQDRLDSSEQLMQCEWLDDVIVRSQLQTENLVVLHPSRREHHHRNVLATLSELANHLVCRLLLEKKKDITGIAALCKSRMNWID